MKLQFLNTGYNFVKWLSRYPRAVAVVLFALLLIEIIAYLQVDAIYFKSGETLNKLQNEALALRVEQMMLEDKIASESSLKTISAKARSYGFQEINKVQYINRGRFSK